MKKLSIFLMLCLACFGVANAQQTLTVCDGTVEEQHIPIYAYSGDTDGTTSEFIIPETELTQLNGKEITALKFYLSQSQSKTWTAVYQVYMAEVATTQLTRTIGPDAGTVVYEGTVDASGSEMTITFNQGHYTYNGGHLLIGTYVATAGAWDSNGKFYGITATAASYLSGSWGGYDDGGFDFIPKTTFTYLTDDPYITLNPASATVITGFTETITATYGNVTNPTITYTSSNTSVATVLGNGNTATVTGVSAGTATITATMTVNGTDYTATCDITVEDPSYCTPNPTSVDGKGITALTFGSGDYVVNNSNSNGLPSSSPFYGDYTSMVGGYEPGETATVTITYSTGSGTVYSYGTLIWVDWNKNYTFEDSEIVYTGTSAQGSGGTPQVLTATFTVPATQAADDYRMRIAGADSYFDSYISGTTSANHSPCFSSTYAVCHDYTLRVATANPCGMPTNLQSQVGTTTANLSWDGQNDSYVLQYRTAAQDMNMSVWQEQGDDIEAPGVFTQLEFDLSEYSGTGYIAIRHYACSGQWQMTIDDVVVTDANGQTVASADFNDGSIPSGWVNLDYDNDGHSWQIANFGDDAGCQHGAYCLMSASYASGEDLTPDNYLIIPNVELGGTLSFYVCSTDADWPENFGVFVATQSYEGVPAGDWSAEIPVSTTSYPLTGLTSNTPYEWRVKGICNGYSEPSNWAISSFTTIAEGFKTFVTEGNWDVAANWFPEGVPSITDEVSIEAAVTIPSGVVATAKKATINGGSVLIKDGGQLKQGSFTLKVTMEKEITGYGESTGKDHYYFIATPLTGTTDLGYNSAWNYVTNLNVGDYDFYWFDGSQVTEEWQNFEALSSTDADDFYMNPNVGYLYANKADKTLQFVGNTKGTNNPTTLDITFDETSTAPFNGWSLVGNPYSCNAYLSYVDANGDALEADFYTLNDSDTYIQSESSVALAPLTGALVNYSATGKVQFSTEAPAKTTGKLNMYLTEGGKTIDQARIRFGQGYNMQHMSFRNSSKIYMPVDGNDYAVVYTENQGEQPVSFKAEENGTYTLSFNTENVELGYLHLIDNMTGADVDLLSTPGYSFEARTTDYTSRFKLVFATGNADNSFAFFSNGSFVINNEGNATVQMIDINGRIINSTSINGCANINVNATPGVYMLRLINGENVKVQKVVVR